jgi:hypothetical protein
MTNSRRYLRDYGQCSTLRNLIAEVERTIRLLTALLRDTNDPIQRENIQDGLTAANNELDGLLQALAAAGCNEVPVNYTGNWIYAANQNAITVYPLGATGNVYPSRTISGSQTGLAGPFGLALDSTSYLFVANLAASTITIYAPSAHDNVLPVRVIAGPLTGLYVPLALAMDQQDNLYALNAGGNPLYRTVTMYAQGSYGNVQPTRIYQNIEFSDENLAGITVDGNGELYIGHQGPDAVSVHNPNGTLSRVIAGPSTLLYQPASVVVDAEGNLYVLNQSSGTVLNPGPGTVTVYPPGADGDVAPNLVLTVGPPTPWESPWPFAAAMSIDGNANIYVACTTGYAAGGSIAEYAAGSSGNASPGETIIGPQTALNDPSAILIEDPDVHPVVVPPVPIGGGGRIGGG